ncbi:hypothetical protein BDW62DRAFT_201000 [Aspergillus aurantiobrunneus]
MAKPDRRESISKSRLSQEASSPVPPITTLPLDLIRAVIHEIKVNENRPVFLCSYPLNDITLVERLCNSTFSSSDSTLPSTHLACTYGVLYFVLREFASSRSSDPVSQRFSFLRSPNPISERSDLDEAISTCERNFDALIEDCDVLNVPSFGSVLALTIGSMKAQSQANPVLECTLISRAASHCQSLGYQHDSKHENSSNSRRLFWCVYMIEKQVSLFFGHAPLILDADVDVAKPIRSSRPWAHPWDEAFLKRIELAKIQSRIYEELYSKETLELDDFEREGRIQELAVSLQFWYFGIPHLTTSSSKIPGDLLEAKYYATFTILLRALNSSKTGQIHIPPDCFKVARSALQFCQRGFNWYQKIGLSSEKQKYADWDLLSCVLDPFIIMTLHAIASSDPEDEILLNEVVSTLQDINQSTSSSSACTKLYKLTSTLCHVATGLAKQRGPVIPGSGWRYSQHEDALSFTGTRADADPVSGPDGLVRRRPASASVADPVSSSIFGGETDGHSLFHQVVDDDVRDLVGEDEKEELFRFFEGWMGGLVSGLEVFEP